MRTWYRWALRQDHKLHPAATLVAVELSGSHLENHPTTTIPKLGRVLRQVVHGVWLQDVPGQKNTATCITHAGATQRSCSTPVVPAYTTLMEDIRTMLTDAHRLSIPTLQWFCGDGVCPSVINHTLTTHDGDHLTMEYSAALAPLLAPEMHRILTRLG